jgi:methylenetetrahydrofolate dehydrogenase (NADP+) / methenyltetrahydrofolate cyclohydrolase
MILIDGKLVSEKIKDKLSKIIKKENLEPGLGIILVGSRPDSKVYVEMKKKACNKIGIRNIDITLDSNISEEDLIKEIEKMNNNDYIHGILIQLPLPKHINTENVLSKVSIEKDVDGFHSENMGKLALNYNDKYFSPCTPEGCIELLRYYNIKLEGKNIVVIGKSNIVGLPLSLMLMNHDATVTVCHIKTQNLKNHTKNADIVFSACGVPNFITKEFLKKDVIVIDIGINKVPIDDAENNKKKYKIVGDVNFEDVKDIVSAITPVPGGVGPMTIATLLNHTVISCQNFNSKLSNNK